MFFSETAAIPPAYSIVTPEPGLTSPVNFEFVIVEFEIVPTKPPTFELFAVEVIFTATSQSVTLPFWILQSLINYKICNGCSFYIYTSIVILAFSKIIF